MLVWTGILACDVAGGNAFVASPNGKAEAECISN